MNLAVGVIRLYPRDFEPSCTFYGEVLGLTLLQTWEREGIKGAVFDAGAVQIELRTRPVGSAAGPGSAGPGPSASDPAIRTTQVRQSPKFELVLEVDDVEAAYGIFQKKGLVAPRPPEQSRGGSYSFRFTDPEGISISVAQRAPGETSR